MPELAKHARVVRLLAERGGVETVLDRAADDVRGEVRGARIGLIALRIVELHGIAAAIGDLLLLFRRRERAVEYLLAVEDRERRLDVVQEPFVMVVADDDQHIGIDLGQPLTEHVELALTARVALAADVERVLLFEMLALAKLVELLEVIGAGAERQRLVLAIHVGAEVPLMGRRRQQRAMGRSKSEHDLSHCESIHQSGQTAPRRRFCFASRLRRVYRTPEAPGKCYLPPAGESGASKIVVPPVRSR